MPISKLELKKKLRSLGIKVEGNYVKKHDITKILSESENPKIKALRSAITNLKADDIDDMTAPELVALLQELYDLLYSYVGFELEGIIVDKI